MHYGECCKYKELAEDSRGNHVLKRSGIRIHYIAVCYTRVEESCRKQGPGGECSVEWLNTILGTTASKVSTVTFCRIKCME